MDKAIQMQDVSLSLNGHSVLKDVNFSVDKKDFVAVIGPNGGGKTTLLKLMLGLMKPNHGKIRILGKNPEKASHRIGYVSQEIGINKHFPISVMDVVMMGRLRPGKRWSWHGRADKSIAASCLEQMEMYAFRNRRIGDLSGGQRQRVFIARALASEPELLFLDEPTASIDSHGQTAFYDILKDINKEVGIVLVSHDFIVISAYVKSVMCVNETVIFHPASEVTGEMIDKFHCSVELVAHGMPHRVLKKHNGGQHRHD